MSVALSFVRPRLRAHRRSVDVRLTFTRAPAVPSRRRRRSPTLLVPLEGPPAGTRPVQGPNPEVSPVMRPAPGPPGRAILHPSCRRAGPGLFCALPAAPACRPQEGRRAVGFRSSALPPGTLGVDTGLQTPRVFAPVLFSGASGKRWPPSSPQVPLLKGTQAGNALSNTSTTDSGTRVPEALPHRPPEKSRGKNTFRVSRPVSPRTPRTMTKTETWRHDRGKIYKDAGTNRSIRGWDLPVGDGR